ncbi:hypothetical protein [Dactylosporangium sp. NPDC051541]|uniref:hypothetical protein n=1 Tax=Dactylosporangium sp. NPDC051541 TaxID=3363977 RepID=UPI0037AB9603
MQSTVHEQGQAQALDPFDQPLGDIPAELAENLLRCNDRRPDDEAPLPVAAFGASL